MNGRPDGRVDMKDLSLVAKHFNSSPTKPDWDHNLDINGDSRIDMKDIAMIAKHFGEHYP
jgi:hypothetical protein